MLNDHCHRLSTHLQLIIIIIIIVIRDGSKLNTKWQNNTMKQRPSCKADRCSASHGISLIIRKSIFINVFTTARNSFVFRDISSQHQAITCFKVTFYITLISTLKPSKLPISFRFSNQKSVRKTPPRKQMANPSYLLWFYCPDIIWSAVKKVPHYLGSPPFQVQIFFSVT
jgi:hypothetical protein